MGEETNSIERYGQIGPLRDQPRPNRRQKFVDRDSMREDDNSVRDLEECGSASQLLQFVGRDSKVELQLTRYISKSRVQSFLRLVYQSLYRYSILIATGYESSHLLATRIVAQEPLHLRGSTNS